MLGVMRPREQFVTTEADARERNPANAMQHPAARIGSEPGGANPSLEGSTRLRGLVSQFAMLSLAEIICRIISLAVVLELIRRTGRDGYGRIEFCFSLVHCLIFLIRDGVELVFYRDLSRRSRPNPRIIGSYIALKIQVAMILWAGLLAASLAIFHDAADRLLLSSFGLLLIPTSIGLDNVFRSLRRAGLIAVSLVIRTCVYATGVALLVTDANRLLFVPWLFFGGELCGIALVWFVFTREFGLPRLKARNGRRFAGPVLAQGKAILGLQLTLVAISSMDVLLIGCLDEWGKVGLYGAPHRIVSAAITFAVIFQQVLLPQLVRSWIRDRGRQRLEIQRITFAAMGFIVPATFMLSLMSHWIVRALFTAEFQEASPLLAIGIWRVPLMAMGSIHMTALVATHRERLGLAIMSGCLAIALPVVILSHTVYGLEGTAAAMLFTAALASFATGIAVYRKSDADRRYEAIPHIQGRVDPGADSRETPHKSMAESRPGNRLA